MKEKFEEIINYALERGADFVELFYEDTKLKAYQYLNSRIDKTNTSYTKGVGIRLIYQDEVYYGSSSDMSVDAMKRIVDQFMATESMRDNIRFSLNELEVLEEEVLIPHSSFGIDKKKELFIKIDRLARNASSLINQVIVTLKEVDRVIVVANSEGVFKKEVRTYTMLSVSSYAFENGQTVSLYESYSKKMGYEFLNDVNLEEDIPKLSEKVIHLLHAKECPKGEMPVVINNGFGAVIFHEACGHALEATVTAKGIGVLSGRKGQKIASDKVTLIDDGTDPFLFGSIQMDDEGMPSKKNVLIENGVLTSYLVDYKNISKMEQERTGSGRREGYRYAPTSRMTNTYLKPGNDSIEEMIKSIDHGLYCDSMNGGTVTVETGDFNFNTTIAREICHGELGDWVKNASLIGNTKDILKGVSMVSDDLVHSPGYCGSASGTVYVTCGQPTIKVDRILVGGKGE